MRKTKEEALLTKEAILDSGLDLFVEKGFETTTLEEIAELAGVTRGAIYWHFENKTDLFRQIVTRENKELDLQLNPVLKSTDSSLGKLRNLLFRVIDNFYKSPRFRKYIELTWYRLNRELFDESMQYKTSYVQSFLSKMQTLLINAKEQKEIKQEIDPIIAAFHFSCLINGFYRLYFSAPEKGRSQETTQQVFQEYFDYICPESK